MNEKAAIFKSEPIKLILGDKEYRLIFDLNAFCELEKIYDSVDTVIQMLLNNTEAVDVNKLATQVKVKDMFVNVADVTVAGTPLMDYISKAHVHAAKHVDTMNLLWAATLHDNTIYNAQDEIIGYTVSKRALGAEVTFANLRTVNASIVAALLQDLLPKKAPAPVQAEEPVPQEAPKLQLVPSAE